MAVAITTEQLGRPSGLISPAYKSNGLVFASGHVGMDYSTNSLKETVEEQTVQAIENLKKTVEAAGSSLSKVIKISLFISDGADSAKVNAIYKQYFPNKPARYCVVVQFPNKKIKVEMDCVAEYSQSHL
ncbi:hypothetical protein DASC09_037760 [Saccharomycopsis crataegensis]|uniref:Uncharacterized protein n=1 Tax=Saccharomycopsis crataegensis TaxID=43959 RepID=A0AAV5QPG2_9ASCO|nr:hypothetical protein DASC09_037760 [Saccharomycopsis crataegensis]